MGALLHNFGKRDGNLILQYDLVYSVDTVFSAINDLVELSLIADGPMS